MSEGPTPLEPLRVLPVEFPPMRRDRPGFVTALGVSAIVIASLSMLASAVLTVTAIGMAISSQISAAQIASMNSAKWMQQQAQAAAMRHAKAAPLSPDPDADGVIADERVGLNTGVRRLVVNALAKKERLSEEQEHQLHRLLAKAGKEIFPFANRATPASVFEANISGSGHVATASGNPALYFVVGSGRIELHDDRAIFSPSDADEHTVRVQDGFDDDAQAVEDQPVNISPTPPASIPIVTPFHVRGEASTTTIVTSIVSGLLAIYLLVVGLLLLRQSRYARGLQIIFALIKIPLALIAALGWMWAVSDAKGMTSDDWPMFVIFALMGCAYPLALLIALSVPSVRKYYSGDVD